MTELLETRVLAYENRGKIQFSTCGFHFKKVLISPHCQMPVHENWKCVASCFINQLKEAFFGLPVAQIRLSGQAGSPKGLPGAYLVASSHTQSSFLPSPSKAGEWGERSFSTLFLLFCSIIISSPIFMPLQRYTRNPLPSARNSTGRQEGLLPMAGWWRLWGHAEKSILAQSQEIGSRAWILLTGWATGTLSLWPWSSL